MIEIERKKGRKPVPDETKERIVALYGEGNLKVDEIASMCHVSRGSVYKILKDCDSGIYRNKFKTRFAER